MLLRGLGLPDADIQRSRILVMIEEVGRRQGASLKRAKSLFHLTDREQPVVRHLLRGRTNKQIANELGIAEQTVKEHIKHIMQKTKASTRTGILVQILAHDTDQEMMERPSLSQPLGMIPLPRPPRRRRRAASHSRVNGRMAR
jgi:DNA-binding CsgD family transcriptional regulator